MRSRTAAAALFFSMEGGSSAGPLLCACRKCCASREEDAHLLYLGYSQDWIATGVSMPAVSEFWYTCICRVCTVVAGQAADWRREVSAELVESLYVWTHLGLRNL